MTPLTDDEILENIRLANRDELKSEHNPPLCSANTSILERLSFAKKDAFLKLREIEIMERTCTDDLYVKNPRLLEIKNKLKMQLSSRMDDRDYPLNDIEEKRRQNSGRVAGVVCLVIFIIIAFVTR